ncbi:MAG: zinc ribbon domain-containing protein [Firmicutes bacterium]|nr:zinc ribbon domain-containing protein [Bacillota bacterium]
MPLYEYVCQKCGHVLEVLQKTGQDQAGQDCPVCHGQELVKRISAPNINRPTSSSSIKEGSCCGATERSASCPPGGCCGTR